MNKINWEQKIEMLDAANVMKSKDNYKAEPRWNVIWNTAKRAGFSIVPVEIREIER